MYTHTDSNELSEKTYHMSLMKQIDFSPFNTHTVLGCISFRQDR